MKKLATRGVQLAIVLAVLAGITYALWPRPVPVDVVAAVVEPMLVTVDEDGTTRIRERYIVSSPLPGRVRRITLDPGDPVQAERTTLAQLEPTAPVLLDARALAEARGRVNAAEAAVRQAQAELERTRAAFDLTENELARLRTARANGAATDTELDRAESAHRQAGGDFRSAEFRVEIAAHELDVAESALLFAQGDDPDDAARVQMPLSSPIDGVVLHVHQESVAVVTAGTPLIEVGDPTDLELVIDVLSTDAISVRPGQRVLVEQWGGGRPLEAVVRLVEPAAFLKISALGIEEQRVNVIADLVSPMEERETLGDNFHIEARIVTWQSDAALVVPTSALFRRGDAWAIFVLVDGLLEVRTIEVGRLNGRMSQIVSGVAEGESVVVHPSDSLAAGVRATVRSDA